MVTIIVTTFIILWNIFKAAIVEYQQWKQHRHAFYKVRRKQPCTCSKTVNFLVLLNALYREWCDSYIPLFSIQSMRCADETGRCKHTDKRTYITKGIKIYYFIYTSLFLIDFLNVFHVSSKYIPIVAYKLFRCQVEDLFWRNIEIIINSIKNTAII